MFEKSKDRRTHLPSKGSLMRFGAVASAAAAFSAPAAQAKTFDQPAQNGANTYLPAEAPQAETNQSQENLNPKQMQAVRDGAMILQEMHDNVRPDVISSAVVELDAGTHMAYGPHKGSPFEVVPKGQIAFVEFPHMAFVDGRVVIRGLSNNGVVDDQTVDALDSRWVDVSAKTVHFYYPHELSGNSNLPRSIPVKPGVGNNLVSDASWFQGAPELMSLTLLTSPMPANTAPGQRNYWGLASKPGPKPSPSDISAYKVAGS